MLILNKTICIPSTIFIYQNTLLKCNSFIKIGPHIMIIRLKCFLFYIVNKQLLCTILIRCKFCTLLKVCSSMYIFYINIGVGPDFPSTQNTQGQDSIRIVTQQICANKQKMERTVLQSTKNTAVL